MSKDNRITLRMADEAKYNLDAYCRITGQSPAEAARAGLALIIAPYIGQIMLMPKQVVQETVQVEETKNRLEDNSERTAFTQKFIGSISYKKFPPRIAKAIKEQWEHIQESQIPAGMLAEYYEDYRTAEKSANRECCDPNSWITNHGWLNENGEGTGGPIYDTDR